MILTSDDSIVASFETYALFEKASGSKLNQSKSKGALVDGVVALFLQLLWIGPPPKSKSLVFSSVLVTSMRQIGDRVLMRWTMF